MKIIAIVQARMDSTRFPNKVMKKINGVPMIGLLLNRLSMVSYLDQIMLATPSSPNSLPLDNYVTKLGYEVFKGSEDAKSQDAYKKILELFPDAVLVDIKLKDEE